MLLLTFIITLTLTASALADCGELNDCCGGKCKGKMFSCCTSPLSCLPYASVCPDSGTCIPRAWSCQSVGAAATMTAPTSTTTSTSVSPAAPPPPAPQPPDEIDGQDVTPTEENEMIKAGEDGGHWR